jgi:GDPmannose 4,6-dehydratase
MKTVLITGISGQDGSYLAERLLAEGCTVHGLLRPRDDKATEAQGLLPGVVWHTVDLRDSGRILEIVVSIAPEEIYNLAGISSVAQSWKDPVTTAQVTGLAVISILQAAAALHERGTVSPRFVQASSSEIFGSPLHSPQTESTPIQPTSPYGAAKAFAHHFVGIYRASGVHASNCILYNHESPRRPDTFVTRKITLAAARIAAGLQETLTLGDTSIRRDWGWAPDFVDAMVRAARHDTPGDYVIAAGENHSIEEFAQLAFRAAGVHDWRTRIRIDQELIRPADIADMRGDATKARDVLGWRTTVNFQELVARMVEHDSQAVRATRT